MLVETTSKSPDFAEQQDWGANKALEVFESQLGLVTHS
jgi:hypothetical protein